MFFWMILEKFSFILKYLIVENIYVYLKYNIAKS